MSSLTNVIIIILLLLSNLRDTFSKPISITLLLCSPLLFCPCQWLNLTTIQTEIMSKHLTEQAKAGCLPPTETDKDSDWPDRNHKATTNVYQTNCGSKLSSTSGQDVYKGRKIGRRTSGTGKQSFSSYNGGSELKIPRHKPRSAIKKYPLILVIYFISPKRLLRIFAAKSRIL